MIYTKLWLPTHLQPTPWARPCPHWSTCRLSRGRSTATPVPPSRKSCIGIAERTSFPSAHISLSGCLSTRCLWYRTTGRPVALHHGRYHVALQNNQLHQRDIVFVHKRKNRLSSMQKKQILHLLLSSVVWRNWFCHYTNSSQSAELLPSSLWPWKCGSNDQNTCHVLVLFSQKEWTWCYQWLPCLLCISLIFLYVSYISLIYISLIYISILLSLKHRSSKTKLKNFNEHRFEEPYFWDKKNSRVGHMQKKLKGRPHAKKVQV